MLEIVLKLHQKNAGSLGSVRIIDDLKVAMEGDSIWLRGILYSEEIDLRLRQLPVLQTYLTDANEFLFIPGHATPVEKLPSLKWMPISTFLPLELPVSALPGRTNSNIPFSLVPGTESRKGVALLTSLTHWKQYAETASAIRLQPLQFAVSEKEEVLIIGTPLPALPGKEYWITNDLLIPSGYEPAIPLSVMFFVNEWNEGRKKYLLLSADSSWQSIPKEFFVPATRSGVRLSGNAGSQQRMHS